MKNWNWLGRLIHAVQRPKRPKARRRPRFSTFIETLEDRALLAHFIAVGTDAGVQAEVRILADNDRNGAFETLTTDLGGGYAFRPYGGFTGGARVAFGDFNGDGNDELVVAAGPGGGPHVIIYELTSGGLPGAVLDSFFAYAPTFSGGVFVASGDINGDGKDELITAPDTGGGPHVKIFSDTDGDGALSDNLVDQFFPYGGFTGGVRLATGDVNGDGRDEVITAAGPGGSPHVIVFTNRDTDLQITDGPNSILEQFLAYGSGFAGGVYVGAGPISSAGTGTGAEIITSPGAGGGPHVKVFTDANGNGLVNDDPLFDQFFAYPGFTGGVRLAAGDTDNSGLFVEVITIPGPGGGSHLKIYDDTSDAGNLISDNPLGDERFAYPPNLSVGFFVARGRVTTSRFAFVEPTGIPDGTAGAPLTTSIFVPSSAGIISNLDVHLNIQHTFAADLDVTLLHVPSGRSVTLFTDIGSDDDGIYVRLSDGAGTDIGTVADDPNDRPVTGSFNLQGAALLSLFDSLDASGEWRLTIDDDANSDLGTLLSWILAFDHF